MGWDHANPDFIKIRDRKLIQKIRGLAGAAHIAPATWCCEALEYFILEHRSGKEHIDPDRYTERFGDDDEYHLHTDPYGESVEV